MPLQYGHTDESYVPPQGLSSKKIIYIQDAHDSLEAQQNIARMIAHLVGLHGVRKIFEEGYEGPVPTDNFFAGIKDPQTREKVAYFLMDKLRIGGAEYAHINRRKDFELVGADNRALHLQNIEWYRRTAKYKAKAEREWSFLDKQIRKLAKQHFPKELKEWIKLKDRQSRGQLGLGEYLERMAGFYTKHRPLKNFQIRYPAVALAALDQSRPDERNVLLLQRLDPKQLFREINRLEEEYADIVLKGDGEKSPPKGSRADTALMRNRQILAFLRGLELLHRLNALEVTPPEYEVSRKMLSALKTKNLARFIARESGKSVIFSKLWEMNIRSAVKFYETARAREEAIQKTLEKWLQTPGEETAVLVYGGFHNKGVKACLRDLGISYAVVSPRITSASKRHREYYRQLMSDGHYAFEVPFNLAHASRAETTFVQATVYGEEPVRAEIRAIAAAVEGKKMDRALLSRVTEKALGHPDIRPQERPSTPVAQLPRPSARNSGKKQEQPKNPVRAAALSFSLAGFVGLWAGESGRRFETVAGLFQAGRAESRSAARLVDPEDFRFLDVRGDEQVTRATTLYLDPAQVEPVLSVHEEMIGKLAAFDRKRLKTIAWDDAGKRQEYFGSAVKQVYKKRRPWQEHLRLIGEKYPRQKAIAVVGNGNLMFSSHIAGWINGRVVAPVGEPVGRRVYSSLVIYRNGRVAIEAIAYRRKRGVLRVFSRTQNKDITDSVRFITSGPRIVRNGGRVPLAETMRDVSDVRWLFKMPVIQNEGEGIFWGMDQLLDEHDSPNRLAYRAAAGRAIDLKLEVLGRTIEADGLRAALQAPDLNYREVGKDAVRQEGDFAITGSDVRIRFRTSRYPHHVIGLDKGGGIIVSQIQGRSGHVGAALEELPDWMLERGAQDAILLDNGGDVRMDYEGRNIVPSAENREVYLSVLAFLAKEGRPRTEMRASGAGLGSMEIIRNPLRHTVVTVDGPSATGKGTVARELARRLGFIHVDLGSIYRAVAEKALTEGVDIQNAEAIGRLIAATTLDLELRDSTLHVIRDGVDVTDRIRTTEVGNATALLSRHRVTHQLLFQVARTIGESHDIVIEGRNAGTDIFPDATGRKFYLVADMKVRASRRQMDYARKGEAKPVEEVERELVERDEMDRTREIAPLRKAEDAVEIDNTDRSAAETVDVMEQLVRQKIFAASANLPYAHDAGKLSRPDLWAGDSDYVDNAPIDAEIEAQGMFLYLWHARNHGRFDEVSDEELMRLRAKGYNVLWVMGAWKRGRFTEPFNRMWNPDRVGSAFSLDDYVIDPELGDEASFRRFVARANRLGMKVVLDVVPTHMGVDSRWVVEEPDLFVHSDEARDVATPDLNRYLFKEDGSPMDATTFMKQGHSLRRYFMSRDAGGRLRAMAHSTDHIKGAIPYIDSAKVNYANPRAVEWIGGIMDYVCWLTNGGGARIDIPTTDTQEEFRDKWGRQIEKEFWPEIFRTLRRKYPGALFIPETYFSHEGLFQAFGGDFVYDLHFFEKAVGTEFAKPLSGSALAHYVAEDHGFDPARRLLFIANQDDPSRNWEAVRLGSIMSREREKALAVVMMAGAAGAVMINGGQTEGHDGGASAKTMTRDLSREPLDKDLDDFYTQIMRLTKKPQYRFGETIKITGEDTPHSIFSVRRSYAGEESLVVVNAGDKPARFRYAPRPGAWGLESENSSRWKNAVTGETLPFGTDLEWELQPGEFRILELERASSETVASPEKSPNPFDSGTTRVLGLRSRTEMPRIVYLGDSIMNGTGAGRDLTGLRAAHLRLLKEAGFEYEARGPFHTPPIAEEPEANAHLGDAGKRTEEILRNLKIYLHRLLPKPNPPGSVVVIHAGTNNISQMALEGRKWELGAFVHDIEEMIRYIHRYDPNLTVIVAKIIPRADRGDALERQKNEDTDDFNRLIDEMMERVRRSHPNVYPVDLHSPMMAQGNVNGELYFDYWHPNDKGFAAMAPPLFEVMQENILRSEMRTRVQRPALVPDNGKRWKDITVRAGDPFGETGVPDLTETIYYSWKYSSTFKRMTNEQLSQEFGRLVSERIVIRESSGEQRLLNLFTQVDSAKDPLQQFINNLATGKADELWHFTQFPDIARKVRAGFLSSYIHDRKKLKHIEDRYDWGVALLHEVALRLAQELEGGEAEDRAEMRNELVKRPPNLMQGIFDSIKQVRDGVTGDWLRRARSYADAMKRAELRTEDADDPTVPVVTSADELLSLLKGMSTVHDAPKRLIESVMGDPQIRTRAYRGVYGIEVVRDFIESGYAQGEKFSDGQRARTMWGAFWQASGRAFSYALSDGDGLGIIYEMAEPHLAPYGLHPASMGGDYPPIGEEYAGNETAIPIPASDIRRVWATYYHAESHDWSILEFRTPAMAQGSEETSARAGEGRQEAREAERLPVLSRGRQEMRALSKDLAEKIAAVDLKMKSAAKPVRLSKGEQRVFLSVVPGGGGSVAEQIASAQADLTRLLRDNKIASKDVFKMVLSFGEITDEQREQIKEAFRRYYGGRSPPVITFVEQSPADGSMFTAEIYAAEGKDVEVIRVNENIVVVEDRDTLQVYTGGVTPEKGLSDGYAETMSVLKQTRARLAEAEAVLKELKKIPADYVLDYRRLFRIWFYQNNILGIEADGGQRYQKLNKARYDYFTKSFDGATTPLEPAFDGTTIPFGQGLIDGAEPENPDWPASTGIGMLRGTMVMESLGVIPKNPEVHAYPVDSKRQMRPQDYPQEDLEKEKGTQKENEWKAPPLWRRGMTLVVPLSLSFFGFLFYLFLRFILRREEPGEVYEMISVSGTASTQGSKVRHVGNPYRQALYTLSSINLVLKERGATLRDVPQLRVYVKNPEHYRIMKYVVEKMCPGIPVIYVNSDVCRGDWLIEIEGFAFVKKKRKQLLTQEPVGTFRYPGVTRERLFEKDLTTPEDLSAEERAALLTLIPKAFLQSRNYREDQVLWETESVRLDPKKTQDKPVLFVKKTGGEILLRFYRGGRTAEQAAAEGKVFAEIPIRAEGDTLWILGNGFVKAFPAARLFFKKYSKKTFAYWLQKILVPFHQALGFKRIMIRRLHTPKEDLRRMGFKKLAGEEDTWYYGTPPGQSGTTGGRSEMRMDQKDGEAPSNVRQWLSRLDNAMDAARRTIQRKAQAEEGEITVEEQTILALLGTLQQSLDYVKEVVRKEPIPQDDRERIRHILEDIARRLPEEDTFGAVQDAIAGVLANLGTIPHEEMAVAAMRALVQRYRTEHDETEEEYFGGLYHFADFIEKMIRSRAPYVSARVQAALERDPENIFRGLFGGRRVLILGLSENGEVQRLNSFTFLKSQGLDVRALDPLIPLPLPDHSVDDILVLGPFDRDLERKRAELFPNALPEALRILSPGGHLYVGMASPWPKARGLLKQSGFDVHPVESDTIHSTAYIAVSPKSAETLRDEKLQGEMLHPDDSIRTEMRVAHEQKRLFDALVSGGLEAWQQLVAWRDSSIPVLGQFPQGQTAAQALESPRNDMFSEFRFAEPDSYVATVGSITFMGVQLFYRRKADGHIFMDPMPGPAYFAEVYGPKYMTHYYDEINVDPASALKKKYASAQAHAKTLNDYLSTYVHLKGLKAKVIEIGPGMGFILEHGHNNYDWQVEAVEIAPGFVQELGLKKPSIPVYEERFEDFKLRPGMRGAYHLVIMKDVIEHSANPEKMIENARELLDEDGILFIETQLAQGDDPRFALTEHINLLSYQKLEELLVRAGLEILPVSDAPEGRPEEFSHKSGKKYPFREISVYVRKKQVVPGFAEAIGNVDPSVQKGYQTLHLIRSVFVNWARKSLEDSDSIGLPVKAIRLAEGSQLLAAARHILESEMSTIDEAIDDNAKVLILDGPEPSEAASAERLENIRLRNSAIFEVIAGTKDDSTLKRYLEELLDEAKEGDLENGWLIRALRNQLAARLEVVNFDGKKFFKFTQHHQNFLRGRVMALVENIARAGTAEEPQREDIEAINRELTDLAESGYSNQVASFLNLVQRQYPKLRERILGPSTLRIIVATAGRAETRTSLAAADGNAATDSPEGVIGRGEIERAIDEINQHEHRPIFNDAQKSKIAKALESMRLVKGRTFLVCGPGSSDFLPVLIAKLGLQTSAIDFDSSENESFGDLLDRYHLKQSVPLFSSYAEFGDKRFDYISMFGLLHYIYDFTEDPVLGDFHEKILSAPVRERERWNQAARQHTFQKMKSWMGPVVEHLNPDGGRLFLNVPEIYPGDQLAIAQGATYYRHELEYADQALGDLAPGYGIRFERQSEIDLTDFSMSRLFLNEKREGVAYKSIRVEGLLSRLPGGGERSETRTGVRPGEEQFWKARYARMPQDGLFKPGAYPPEVEAYVLDSIRLLTTASQLRDGPLRLIDLGASPNTYMLRRIQEAFPGIELHGLDIVPLEGKGVPGIVFHEASMDDTGLPSSSFPLVISTYSSEYTDLKETAREIDRLLPEGGAAILVVHQPGSIFTRDYETALNQLERIRAEGLDVLADLRDGTLRSWEELSARMPHLVKQHDTWNEIRDAVIEQAPSHFAILEEQITMLRRTISNIKRLANPGTLEQLFPKSRYAIQTKPLFLKEDPIAQGIVLTKRVAAQTADTREPRAETRVKEKTLRLTSRDEFKLKLMSEVGLLSGKLVEALYTHLGVADANPGQKDPEDLHYDNIGYVTSRDIKDRMTFDRWFIVALDAPGGGTADKVVSRLMEHAYKEDELSRTFMNTLVIVADGNSVKKDSVSWPVSRWSHILVPDHYYHQAKEIFGKIKTVKIIPVPAVRRSWNALSSAAGFNYTVDCPDYGKVLSEISLPGNAAALHMVRLEPDSFLEWEQKQPSLNNIAAALQRMLEFSSVGLSPQEIEAFRILLAEKQAPRIEMRKPLSPAKPFKSLRSIEETLVLEDFNEMLDPEDPDQFSEEQMAEAVKLAAASKGKVRVVIYNADLSKPSYRKLSDLITQLEQDYPALKDKIELSRDSFPKLAGRRIREWQGPIIHLSKNQADFSNVLKAAGLGDKVFDFRYADEKGSRLDTAGTLGVAVVAAEAIRKQTADLLKRSVPEEGVYYDPKRDRFYADSEHAGIWSKLYDAMFVVEFAKAA